MLPEERRQHILAIVKQSGSATIRDLARQFHVSEMTIHRDLAVLEGSHAIRKIRGGALSVAQDIHLPMVRPCSVCRKPPRPHLAFSIVPRQGEALAFCCPHCGILGWRNGHDVDAVLATDSLSGQTLNAFQAWFVVGSSKIPCCSPSVYVFDLQQDALRFAEAFAGEVLPFADAVAAVTRRMTGQA